jgi:hypothetical protein
MSPLVIVLIVLAVVLVLGMGACFVVCVGIGAAAMDQPATSESPEASAPVAQTGPSDDAGKSAASPVATAITSAKSPAPTADPNGGGGGGGSWRCTAQGFTRICGVNNNCYNREKLGHGTGPDRETARNAAVAACGLGCTVSCQQTGH